MKSFKQHIKEQLETRSFSTESEKHQFMISEWDKRSKEIDELYSDGDAFTIMEENDVLLEKLITFGGKAYPKFGNVVILAGGAGSGKGFTLKNILGIEGKVFDVDKLKGLSISSTHLANKIESETGVDIRKLKLNNSDDVLKLHQLIGDTYHFPEREQQQFFNNLVTIMFSPESRKPNIIFDVTLKSEKKLYDISSKVQEMGYDKKNIHIVWVLTHIDVAMAQNAKRERIVMPEILLQTHEGVSITMHKFLSNADNLRKWMDGDFYITPSVSGTGKDNEKTKSPYGGQFISKATYYLVKKQGEAPKSIEDLSKIIVGDTNLLAKIKDYVPKIKEW